MDEIGFACNHGITCGVVKKTNTAKGERFVWEHPSGFKLNTSAASGQFYRLQKALEAAEPAVQQDFMEEVLKASLPALVTL